MKLPSYEEDGLQRHCNDANNPASCIQAKFLLLSPYSTLPQPIPPTTLHADFDMVDCQVLRRKLGQSKSY